MRTKSRVSKRKRTKMNEKQLNEDEKIWAAWIPKKRLRSAVSVVTKSEGDGNILINKAGKTEEDDVPVENVKKEIPEDEEANIEQLAQKDEKDENNNKVDNNAAKPGRPARRGIVNPRDRRIFSTLLQGTLISFNRQSTDDKTLMKRKEVELKIEEKVASEQKNLLEAERQKTEEEKQRCLEKVAQVKDEIKQKELQLSKLKLAQHQQLLSGFLKTKATPPIYFYPAKTDEFTERVLSTKKKIEPPKETVLEESIVAEEVPVNQGGGEGDDVEVEAFTREREVGLPVVQQEQEDMDEGKEEDGKKN